MEYNSYREVCVPISAYVLKNGKEKEKGVYFNLSKFKGDMEVQNKKVLEALENKNCGYFYEATEKNFEKIPGMPIGYWASERVVKIFENEKIDIYHDVRSGIMTGDDEKYLRQWYEAKNTDIGFNFKRSNQIIESGKIWYPLNKGGGFRKWYGNNDYIIDLENKGERIKESGKNYRLREERFYFKKGITWSEVSSSKSSFRFSENGFLFGSTGPMLFPKNKKEKQIFNVLGMLNTKINNYILNFINPTLHFNVGSISLLPLNKKIIESDRLENISNRCVKIAKYDWNTFETAWDFKVSPLANIERYVEEFGNVEIGENGNIENKKIDKTQITLIEEAYNKYKEFTNNQFLKLKENEEELNRIFIDIYGLQDELTSDVSDKDITIAKIFDTDDEINDEIKGNSYVLTKADVVKQFISYAVGCMFGRYSLDEEGLVFAGGEFDKNKYSKFIPDEDNCIPITDSEYFSDDIVTRFVEFVKTVYGEETLEENLKFIAQALSNKNDAPKDIIREYFLKSFYDYHLKRYKKRPIYWLYDAGKKNGFKALIYMHRYNEQTTAKVRIGYLHELQKHYERRASFLKDEIESNNNRKKAEQELKKIKSQLDECKQFDEKMNHLSSEYISIDLDDGVKVNYEKVQTGRDGKKYEILGKVK